MCVFVDTTAATAIVTGFIAALSARGGVFVAAVALTTVTLSAPVAVAGRRTNDTGFITAHAAGVGIFVAAVAAAAVTLSAAVAVAGSRALYCSSIATVAYRDLKITVRIAK